MDSRDRWSALAGIFGGIAVAFTAIDAILLWQSGESASHHAFSMVLKIGQIIAPVSILLALLIRYRIVGVSRS